MRNPPIIAIDCGASRVSAAVYTTNAEGVPVLENVFVEPLEYDAADDAQWVQAVGDAIRHISTLRRIRGTVNLITPGHLSLTKYIKVPHVDEAKRQRIIQFEARQNIPYPLNEVVWDYQIVHDDGIDFETALCAIKLDIVESLVDQCRESGFEPDIIEPSCMAQVNAFSLGYPELRESTLLINIGGRSSNLLFLAGERYFVRNITIAGATVTQAMADELGQSTAEAEVAKIAFARQRGELDQSEEAGVAFENAQRSFATRLALEVTRSIANYRRQSGGEPPQRVLLTGAGSLLPALPALLAEKLRIPVDYCDPLRGVPFGSGVVEGEIKANAHYLSETVGSALRSCGRGVAAFNLLPSRLLRARTFRQRQPYFVASAALLAIALGVPLLVSSVTVGAYEEKLRNLDAQVEPLRRYNRQIAETNQNIQRIRGQIAGIKGLVETKSNWITFFSDLQDRLVRVEDVWLEKVQVLRPTGPQSQQSALSSSLFGGLAAKQVADGSQVQSLRLNLAGRLLDKNNPLSKVSQESQNRVKTLLTSFVESEFIVAIEDERFDNLQPGVLKFDFILVVNPAKPL